MFIGVIGLGLIGGSMARAFSAKKDNMVFGADINKKTLDKAITDGTIAGVADDIILSKCDIVIIALYPHMTIECLNNKAPIFKKDAIVVDCCGIKKDICKTGRLLSQKYGFTFIGGHPMAGIEKWGYENSFGTLFEKASMVLVPVNDASNKALEQVKEMFMSIGFGCVKVATPQQHDTVIACTSQLAHIVSSCYAKSPTAKDFAGLSAGSFKDMTRVATMNEQMWSELFIDNAQPLIQEIDYLEKHLQQYKQALISNDLNTLTELIREGTQLKAEFDSKEQK